MDTIRLILLMLVGTVTGGILCFLNGLFKKPYLYLRNLVVFAVIGFFVAMQAGYAIRQVFRGYEWLITFIELTLPVFFASGSVFFGMLKEKDHELISMIFTGPLAYVILRMGTSTAIVPCILISFGISAVLFILGLFFTKEYFSFECSVCGGYLIASLYSNCFYLQRWAFWSIFAVLTIGGTVFGIILKKRKTQVDNGITSQAHRQ